MSDLTSSQSQQTVMNEECSDWLEQFKTVYNNLSKKNVDSLTLIYHQDICFEDPLHKITGLNNFISYFNNLFTHVISCTFEINHSIKTSNEAAIYWVMHYQHPKLNAGKTISVTGHSHLKAMDNKVIYHRDYLDAGAMIYEHIPLLGSAIRYLKKRINT